MNNSFVHQSAIILDDVIIGNNVYIGPNCVVGDESYQLLPNSKGFTQIGDNTKIYGGSIICRGVTLAGNNRIDHQCYIGENSMIGIGSVVEYGARIYERVSIGCNTYISGFICNDSEIGDECVIQGDLIHKFVNVDKTKNERSPTVENKVFVGRNAQIIGGIVLHSNSYIGAGSVLTSNAENGQLYLGVPALHKGIAPDIFQANK